MTSVAKDSKKAFKFCKGATRHDLSLFALASRPSRIQMRHHTFLFMPREYVCSLARSAALSREEGECANMYTPYRAFTSDSALRN